MNRHVSLLHASIFYHYGGHVGILPVTPFLGLKIHCYINRTNIFKSREIVYTWEKKKSECTHLFYVIISDVPMLIQSSYLTDIQLLCNTESD